MDDGNSRVFRGLKLVKVVRIVRLLRLFKILRIARFQVIAEEFVEVRIWGRLAIATTWETFLSQSFPPTFASLNNKKRSYPVRHGVDPKIIGVMSTQLNIEKILPRVLRLAESKSFLLTPSIIVRWSTPPSDGSE